VVYNIYLICRRFKNQYDFLHQGKIVKLRKYCLDYSRAVFEFIVKTNARCDCCRRIKIGKAGFKQSSIFKD